VLWLELEYAVAQMLC